MQCEGAIWIRFSDFSFDMELAELFGRIFVVWLQLQHALEAADCGVLVALHRIRLAQVLMNW
jgi:hypothetical protein